MKQEQQQQQQQQLTVMTSSLGDDGLQETSTSSVPDRQHVDDSHDTRPDSPSTAADAIDSAAEDDGTVATTTVRRDTASLSDEDDEDDDNDRDGQKLVIDSSGNCSSDSGEETVN